LFGKINIKTFRYINIFIYRFIHSVYYKAIPCAIRLPLPSASTAFYTSIIAAVVGIVSPIIWFGIVAFFWFCGFIWLIALTRHKDMFDELVKEINSATRQRELGEEPISTQST